MSNPTNAAFQFYFYWIYYFPVNEEYPAAVLADVDEVTRYTPMHVDQAVRIQFSDPDVTHDIDGNEIAIYAFIGKIRDVHCINFLTKSGGEFEKLAFYQQDIDKATVSLNLYKKSNLKRLLNENEVHLLSLKLIIAAYFDKLKIR